MFAAFHNQSPMFVLTVQPLTALNTGHPIRYGHHKTSRKYLYIFSANKARFRRGSTHVPNLTDELSTAKERRLNQFGTAVLVWCGKSVKFDR